MSRSPEYFVRLAGDIIDLFPAGWRAAVAMVLPVAAILAIAPLIMMYLTWLERKVIARMQNRIGPNRVGFEVAGRIPGIRLLYRPLTLLPVVGRWLRQGCFGLGQPHADGIKMLTKEDVVPERADRLVHTLAPVAAVVPALLVFAVIPFGYQMVAVDLNVGLLYFLAVSSVGTLAVFMGGYASRNKFSLLGAMRSVAQIISYEVPAVMSVIAVVMVTGTLSLVRIVEAQEGFWFVCTPWGLAGFLIFFASGLAEVNRTPFDLPEAESELVGGFHTEFSGMKFALFYMGEFLGAFATSAVAVTLFFGGWQGPWLPSWVWFLLKTYALVYVMIWFRGTLPRLRIDQLLGLAWKFLLPLSLVNMGVAGIWLYAPPVWAWVCGALVVAASYVVLVRLNTSPMYAARTYRLVN